MTVKRGTDRIRTVRSHATHETVYRLCTKRGKTFYIGRTSKPLAVRLKEHISTNKRELEVGRVKNFELAKYVLKRGVTIHAVSPLLTCAQAKIVEDSVLAAFRPVANIRGTGRSYKKTIITAEIRNQVLNSPFLPCDVLAYQLGIAPCTVSVIRKSIK